MFCFLKKSLEELFCETYHACLCKQQRLRLIFASLLVTHIENFRCDNNSSVMSGKFQDRPRERVRKSPFSESCSRERPTLPPIRLRPKPSIYLSIYLSISIYRYLYLSISIYLSLSLYLSLYLSLSITIISIYEPSINSMSLQNVSLYEGMVCLWDRKRNGSTKTGKYSCRQIFEDDLRCYHDIFVHII